MELTESIASTHLGNERTLWIHRPRQSLSGRAAALLIFLDGEIYRERIGALDTLATFSGSDDVADTWAVFVSTAGDEARWRECPCHPPFARFIADELLPWLERRFPATSATSRRVVIGASYTGLAAAYVALQRPGLFTHVIAQSGSFWWNDGWLIDTVPAQPELGATAFYLEVGRRETQQNLQHRPDVFQASSQLDAVQRFRDALLARGVPVRYVETDGAHDYTAWQQSLPAALRWALSAA